jgi:hypothetical protein
MMVLLLLFSEQRHQLSKEGGKKEGCVGEKRGKTTTTNEAFQKIMC